MMSFSLVPNFLAARGRGLSELLNMAERGEPIAYWIAAGLAVYLAIVTIYSIFRLISPKTGGRTIFNFLGSILQIGIGGFILFLIVSRLLQVR